MEWFVSSRGEYVSEALDGLYDFVVNDGEMLPERVGESCRPCVGRAGGTVGGRASSGFLHEGVSLDSKNKKIQNSYVDASMASAAVL